MCVMCVCLDAGDRNSFSFVRHCQMLSAWRCGSFCAQEAFLQRDAELDGAQPEIVFTVSAGSFQ